jgi:hypothetical protein
MPFSSSIDRTHSRAISQEIGDRLQTYLGEETEPSASLRRQIDRIQKLDGRSSSTEKRRFGTGPIRTRRDER